MPVMSATPYAITRHIHASYPRKTPKSHNHCQKYTLVGANQ